MSTITATKRRLRPLLASQFHDSNVLKRQKQAPGQQQGPQAALSLLAPSCSWRTFHTQAAAFAALDACTGSREALRVFAEEVSATGQRTFVVATADGVWDRCKSLQPSQRHFYEIIREARPCHLYFDLEFTPATNPGLHGPKLVSLLLGGVADQLAQLYGIPWFDDWALELDSSTPDKFSRHLIVALPGLAFADACHAGRFARLVLLRLLARGRHCSGPGQLLVANKAGSGWTTFVDMAVYTRNRAFRLHLSSKFGKQAPLRLTQRFGGASRCPRTAFFDSLVSVVHPSGGSSSCHSSSSTGKRQQQQPGARRQLLGRPLSLLHVEGVDWQAELQQLPSSWQQVAALQLAPLPHQPPQQGEQPELPVDGCHWQQPQLQQMVSVSRGPSPFPLLERFITSICVKARPIHMQAADGTPTELSATVPVELLCVTGQDCCQEQASACVVWGCVQGGSQGSIRGWWLVPGSHTVCFSIKGNRWCGNVERQHKSNGIYYVADLAGGTYCQRCYDPECRQYRSHTMPLPADVWQQYRPPAPADNNKPAGSCQAADDELLLQLLDGVERCQHQQGQQQHSMDDDDDLCMQLLLEVESRQPTCNMAS